MLEGSIMETRIESLGDKKESLGLHSSKETKQGELSLCVLFSFKFVLVDNWSECLNPLSICKVFRKFWVFA